MHKILNSYLRRLTNLTSRNRSILLLRLATGRFLDLNELDFLNNQPAFSNIQQLISRKKEIFLCKVLDSRDEFSNKVSQKLRMLWRNERFVFEERGARDLYVGWPFARGMFANGTLVRAPLLFFPVSIEMEDNGWKLKPRTDEYCYLNRSFLLAYSHFNQVPVDEKLMDFNFEEFPTDSRSFRVSLYELFKQSEVELNFNQQNFTDNLLPFNNFNKAEFEGRFKKGTITLYPEAVLGLFPQAGSYLVPDYMELLSDHSVQDIASLFAGKNPEDDTSGFEYLSVLKEEQTVTPFKLDAFQENALKAIKSGKSLVIQGPPGTGKSQLISNIMADYASRGKRTLLVCQKRAALDVVAQRLQEVGMGNFVALVHDFKNDRRSLYAQILNQIESLEEYRRLNGSLDAIQLERQFLQASRKIDQMTEELEEFKHALYDQDECGISVKELYLTSQLNGPSVNLKQEFRHFSIEKVDDFKKVLERYHSYMQRFEDGNFLWRERRPFNGFGIKELKSISKLIDEVWDYSGSMVKKASSLLKSEVTYETLEGIADNRDEIVRFINLLKDPAVYRYFNQHREYKDTHKDQLGLANIERVVLDCFRKEGPEVSIPADELGAFQEIIQQRIESRKNIFKWLNWYLFSKEKMQFQRVLRANGLRNTREGFRILLEKIDNRLNLEHNLEKLRNYPWLKEIPDTHRQVDFQGWFYYQKKALEARRIFSEQRNFQQFFAVPLTYQELKTLLESLLNLLDKLPEKKTEWLRYLLPKQVSLIISEPGMKDRMKDSLNKEFENLCQFDSLAAGFTASESSVVNKLYEYHEEHREVDITELFENSLKLAWIEHIETKYPILRIVSSLKLTQIEEEYREQVKTKFEISREILLLKLRENVYKDVKYNRLNNMISYRDLRHQVSKKRRIWPIRKLLSSFTDELLTLIPCWLASPESVSAMVPMKELFDLVIFDEASQCFAEKGIPALYRARQVAITGDSKQLTPNDLYMIRWEEEETDGEIDLEIDSMLDLATKYLPQVHLQGHYRSKSLDLITFSNEHFYKGKLRMLPDYQVLEQGTPAIRYIKINGARENNVNQNEAMEVVMLVFKIMEETPDKSIGVVTFNIQQQQYIMECLEDRAIQSDLSLPEGLIVKNIENVQGDEKDIIIFSVGYAPDKNGRFSMNFGSLNTDGGENRLNVAVTRAREQVYVIASIMPQDLRVGKSKNDGPKLLKKYLEYAWEVSEGTPMELTNSTSQFQSSWYLKEKLKAETFINNSHSLEELLPFADLVLCRSNQYLGLLLTDDDLYHQSISVKDSHVYVPLILKSKGWKFLGLFSREYWMNPDETRERIERFAVKAD